MKKTSKIVLILMVVTAMVIGLASCGDSKAPAKEKKEIVAATTDADMEAMLNTCKPALKKAGYSLKVKMFSEDYVTPNIATNDGDIDVNFFQHVPYLNDFNKDKKTELIAAGPSIFYSNMGLFSDKITSLDQIKDGMSIVISSDATNRTRALRFMENMGLIKLDKKKKTLTKLDVTENKYNLDIKEIDYAMIPKTLPDVDMLIIYPYDMELAGYDIKPIKQDPPEIGSEYGIVLVTNKKNKDAKWLKIMQDTMEGKETQKVVHKYYGDTGVHFLEYNK